MMTTMMMTTTMIAYVCLPLSLRRQHLHSCPTSFHTKIRTTMARVLTNKSLECKLSSYICRISIYPSSASIQLAYHCTLHQWNCVSTAPQVYALWLGGSCCSLSLFTRHNAIEARLVHTLRQYLVTYCLFRLPRCEAILQLTFASCDQSGLLVGHCKLLRCVFCGLCVSTVLPCSVVWLG